MTMSKNILIVSQYFYPENFRVNELAREWKKRGYDVSVIAGIPNYPEGKFFKGYGFLKKRMEYIDGIKVRRIPIIPRGKSNLMMMLNYASFVVSGFLWKTFTPRKADLVFIFEVSPFTQALPGVWFAKRRKIPCYIYVQDLWPETLIHFVGIKNKYIIGFINAIVKYVYKRVEKIFVTSHSYVDAVKLRNIEDEKIIVSPQYAETYASKPIHPNVSLIDPLKFNIIFTGNLGTAQGLEILVEMASLLEGDALSKVHFILLGNGRNEDQLRALIEKHSVSDRFTFIDRVGPSEVPAFLAASKIAYLGFQNNQLFEKLIPAKLQTYMMEKMPILACVSGESDYIIQKAKCGLTAPQNDINKALNHIKTFVSMSDQALKEMGENGYQYAKEVFDKETILNTFDQEFLRK